MVEFYGPYPADLDGRPRYAHVVRLDHYSVLLRRMFEDTDVVQEWTAYLPHRGGSHCIRCNRHMPMNTMSWRSEDTRTRQGRKTRLCNPCIEEMEQAP